MRGDGARREQTAVWEGAAQAYALNSSAKGARKPRSGDQSAMAKTTSAKALANKLPRQGGMKIPSASGGVITEGPAAPGPQDPSCPAKMAICMVPIYFVEHPP